MARLAYAEKYGVEPHLVNPPLLWWMRLDAWELARKQRQVREAVEERGLEKQNDDDRKIYGDLIKEAMRNG